MIAIINYGSGNIQAIASIYGRLGVPYVVAERPDQLTGADHFLLPGVGAFDQCMDALNGSGMREPLTERVVGDGRPVLGICVGMQLLAHSSEEGKRDGLGWVPGVVKRFDRGRIGRDTLLPHMGWNTTKPVKPNGLFTDVDLTPGYYFLHSYYFSCENDEDVLAVTDYGGDFTAAAQRGNVYGVQFHPEKSHQAGIRLLENFSLL